MLFMRWRTSRTNNNENNTSSSNKLNKLTIIYKIDKNKDKIKLFGEDFVENNKNNSYLIIDGKKKWIM